MLSLHFLQHAHKKCLRQFKESIAVRLRRFKNANSLTCLCHERGWTGVADVVTRPDMSVLEALGLDSVDDDHDRLLAQVWMNGCLPGVFAEAVPICSEVTPNAGCKASFACTVVCCSALVIHQSFVRRFTPHELLFGIGGCIHIGMELHRFLPVRCLDLLRRC